jgi:hypothetical protein
LVASHSKWRASLPPPALLESTVQLAIHRLVGFNFCPDALRLTNTRGWVSMIAELTQRLARPAHGTNKLDRHYMADTQSSESERLATHKTETIIEPASSPQNVSFQRSHIVIACSLAIGIAFFLPWIHILFASPSGLDFANQGGNAVMLWVMPIFAVISCGAALGKNYKVAGQLCAAIPFIILAYGYSQEHNILQGLAAGAWIALIAAAILGVAARK